MSPTIVAPALTNLVFLGSAPNVCEGPFRIRRGPNNCGGRDEGARAPSRNDPVPLGVVNVAFGTTTPVIALTYKNGPTLPANGVIGRGGDVEIADTENDVAAVVWVP